MEPTTDQALSPATLRRVIFASSLGTLFEWYDFYLYGSLAVFFGSRFFPPGNETAQLLASLATFGAGFGVRPLGALVFGRIGDLVGRKYTFLMTMATMGVSTALVGFLPAYATWGLGATVLLVLLRLLQGLALGGEYGGATTYVAEHVPDSRRGYYTSYIQTTATLGFFLSMGVIGTTRVLFGEAAFKSGGSLLFGIAGWRLPFLLSFLLLAMSLYVRARMKESPLFVRLKRQGLLSVNPLKESFRNPVNLRYVLLALFGATAGQGVVWYTGQFYTLTFLQTVLKIDWKNAYLIVSIALAIGTPFFLVFGHLSDKIGRKKIILAGCLLAAVTYVPIYMGMRHFSNPRLLAVADPNQMNFVMMVLLVALQVLYVTMVYGPIAAYLVELFPTNIRYTSMSLPYHLGNGWFGGFLPLIATALTSSAMVKDTFGSSSIYVGLVYPIAVCLLTLVVGGLFIHETKDHRIDTAFRSGARQPDFDWSAVLAALGVGLVLLLVAATDFRQDSLKLGFLRALWSDVWLPLVGSGALFALPMLFFRLEFPRVKAVAMVAGCLLLTLSISLFVYPALVRIGGIFHLFAVTLILALYAAALVGAYWIGRLNRAEAAAASRRLQVP
ncbi:MAG: MFS transporter [Polyangiaceae bacterium]|jgi:MFS family permease